MDGSWDRCPICGELVRRSQIQRHANECLDRQVSGHGPLQVLARSNARPELEVDVGARELTATRRRLRRHLAQGAAAGAAAREVVSDGDIDTTSTAAAATAAARGGTGAGDDEGAAAAAIMEAIRGNARRRRRQLERAPRQSVRRGQSKRRLRVSSMYSRRGITAPQYMRKIKGLLYMAPVRGSSMPRKGVLAPVHRTVCCTGEKPTSSCLHTLLDCGCLSPALCVRVWL